MNEFLKSRTQIDEATKFLQDNHYLESGLSCKNWEISQVIPYLNDGNILDLGSNGGVVLQNALLKNVSGIKLGVDVSYTDDSIIEDGQIALQKGDLMNVNAPSGIWDIVTCLSVLEHNVDFSKFAKECSRLLRSGGLLIFSFDYWEPKPDTSKTKLYSLDWNVLDLMDWRRLIIELEKNNFFIVGETDYGLGDAVINDTYCSPAKGVSYTIGIFSYQKK